MPFAVHFAVPMVRPSGQSFEAVGQILKSSRHHDGVTIFSLSVMVSRNNRPHW
jgi:hypothetical protein